MRSQCLAAHIVDVFSSQHTFRMHGKFHRECGSIKHRFDILFQFLRKGGAFPRDLRISLTSQSFHISP
jgi:hypothetical protein